jgi:hypothetical protein
MDVVGIPGANKTMGSAEAEPLRPGIAGTLVITPILSTTSSPESRGILTVKCRPAVLLPGDCAFQDLTPPTASLDGEAEYGPDYGEDYAHSQQAAAHLAHG